MIAQHCQEPGCNGTVQGGLCQACGALYDGVAAAPAKAPGGSGQHCQEPGCKGTIQNGLCQECGAFFDDHGNGGAAAVSTPSSKSSRSYNSKVSARPSSISAVVGGGSSSHRSARSGSLSLSTRRSLGGGLVQVEPQPDVEPLKLVRPDLKIPDNQRLCSNPKCTDDKGNPTLLHLDKGFCPKCRTRYSFTQVEAGTVISGQYEIKGPIAIGGCGFVYMAWDRNVERYVVMKGLINTMDAGAVANAVKEKRFLADLRDPNIVDIVNFVNHDGAQYIVMEFVNGVTLKDIRKQKGPIPVPIAIAYTMAMLPAFEFLHSKKIIYCDFKIENAMVQKDRVRLIDLGGARRVDDLDSDIYLTVGYCAPEAEQDPSYTTDLYTVGRTLAVLLLDFDFRKKYRYTLPTPQEEEIFAKYESLYRFLLRSTAKNPDDRFQSAGEMQSQLEGVLREIVALDNKTPKPAESTLFGVDVRSEANRVGHDSLPVIKVQQSDPARGMVESAISLNDPLKQKAIFQNAMQRFPNSAEAPLRLASCLTDLDEFQAATRLLDELAQKDAYDWRVVWMRGRLLLAQKKHQDALKFFDAVYSEIPDEVAPKLGLAIASELAGDRDTAQRLYDMVSQVDPSYTTAAFGLARCLSEGADRQGAVEAYRRVPALSIAFTTAMMQEVRTLIKSQPAPPSKEDLVRAGDTLGTINETGFERYRLEADLLEKTIELVDRGQLKAAGVTLLGVSMTDVNALRARAETALRQCAKLAPDRDHAIACIDEANMVRPRTMW